MENKYKVIKAHISNYPQPIQLSKGQRVILGKLDDGPQGWRNWRQNLPPILSGRFLLMIN